MRLPALASGLATSLAVSVGGSAAGERQIELGLENFYYRTAETPLNRGNLLRLDRDQDALRGTLHYKESFGAARVVFRGFVERRFGGPGDRTRWTLRQAYLQYGWGSGLSLRAGKQRVAWGSGFAWNPTNRVEPPKNPLNTGLEQEGSLAARMDWIPASWAGVVLVAARGNIRLGDLPFETADERRHTAAVRARFLVKDTDIALVFSGGKSQRTLVGFDLGRDVVEGKVSVHAEGAFYRGSEIAPPRQDRRFLRLAVGALHISGNTSLSLEYFFNGEGYSAAQRDAYLSGLELSYRHGTDPALPPALRLPALAAYLSGAGLPFSAGLGLRRHYLHAAWTRREIRGEWTAAVRGVVGLSDGGVALTPGLVYAPRGDVTLHVDGVLLLGPEQSEFRLAPIRGAVQTRVKVLF